MRDWDYILITTPITTIAITNNINNVNKNNNNYNEKIKIR